MSDYVTVYHNGSALLLKKMVADSLGHHNGKQLTEAQTWEAISRNAAAGIAACELEILRRKVSS